MRIVDVSAFYTPHGGGVRAYVERKLATLPALGHEIIIIAPGPQNSVVERAPGAILVTIAQPALPFDRRYHFFDDRNALHDALDAWRPDFVEASSPWSSATKVGEWQGPAPRALFMHADPMSAYAYRWLGRVATHERIDRICGPFWQHLRTLNAAFDLVVSPGASLSRRLAEGGLDRVVTVPLGVEPGIFRPARADPAMRQALLARLDLPDDGLVLLGVGRFASEKRWPMVIRAAAAAGQHRPVGLLLVGTGKQRARLVREAAAFPHIIVGEATADRDELATMLASATVSSMAARPKPSVSSPAKPALVACRLSFPTPAAPSTSCRPAPGSLTGRPTRIRSLRPSSASMTLPPAPLTALAPPPHASAQWTSISGT